MNLRNRNIQSPTPTLKREDDASVASEDSLEETVNCPSFFPRLPSLFNADSEERAEGGLSTPEGHERSNQGGQDRSNQGDLQLSEEVSSSVSAFTPCLSDSIVETILTSPMTFLFWHSSLAGSEPGKRGHRRQLRYDHRW